MTLTLSAADVLASLPRISDQVNLVSATLIAAEGRAVSQQVAVHPRHGAVVEAAATWLPLTDGILGASWTSDFPANISASLPRSGGLILLSDPESGDLRAVVDAAAIVTATAAAITVASMRRFAADAKTIALIGAGADARAHLAALAAIGIGSSARLFDRDAGRAEELCSWAARSLSYPIEPTASVEQAAVGAELVVSCAPRLTGGRGLRSSDVEAAGLVVSVGRDGGLSAEVARANRWFVVDDPAQFANARQHELADFPDLDESLGQALSTATTRPARVAILVLGTIHCHLSLAAAVVGIAEQGGRGVQVT